MSIIESLDKAIDKYNEFSKLDPIDVNNLGGVFYTDGGGINGVINFGSWGIHGYFYHDVVTKSNSGAKACPTKEGYKEKADEKVPVVGYLNAYGSVMGITNNGAEIIAATRCFECILETQVKKALLLIDSQLVLTLLNDMNKYLDNGMKTSRGESLANLELINNLYDIYRECLTFCEITLKWVKGHSGDLGNTTADRNATAGLNTIKNVISGLKSKDINEVNLKEAIDSGVVYSIQYPKDLIDDSINPPAMLIEKLLYFTTNGMSYGDNRTYYQASLGGKSTSSKKGEKKVYLGKPIADSIYSVVILNQPDPLTEEIKRIIGSSFMKTGIVTCNLMTQTRQSVYHDLLTGGVNTLHVDRDKNLIRMTDKQQIAELVDPVKKAFNDINNFNIMYSILSAYNKGLMPFEHVVDITDVFYELTVNKKGETSYKVINNDTDLYKVPLTINVENISKSTVIPLTLGVDTPSKIGLGRLKSVCPQIFLVTWDIDDRSLRYGMIIKTTEGIGLWASIYSNLHLY